MILVGPRDDHGWSEAHYEAGRYLEETIPDSRMILVDNLNPDARPEMTVASAVAEMAEQGADMVFITSDDFSADTRAVAADYADTVFIHATGDHVLRGDSPQNLGNYMPKMIFGKMIAGCAAALATGSGQIGYVGPLINDETRRLANASYLGARYCYQEYRDQDPASLQFDVEWIGFWFHIPDVTSDPTEVASEMVAEGADVLISGIDTTEVLAVAAERSAAGAEVMAVPYDYEGACEQAPEVCLGTPYFNWRPGYLRLAQEVKEGTWTPRWEWVPPNWDRLNDLEQSPLGFAHGAALTAEQSAQLDEFIANLGDGSLELFAGPLRFQDGSTFLNSGEAASEEAIWYMPQLLEGMEGASE
jgi:simple sugar transport system substrate-binding protein